MHPKPKDETREAFYGWLLGKPVAAERLPAAVQSFVRYQSDRSQELPDVPFQILTALGLTSELARGSVRLTTGLATDDGDVDRLLSVMPGVVARVRSIMPMLLGTRD